MPFVFYFWAGGGELRNYNLIKQYTLFELSKIGLQMYVLYIRKCDTLHGDECCNFMVTHSSLAFYATTTAFGFFLCLTMPFLCGFCFALLYDIAKNYALAFCLLSS